MREVENLEDLPTVRVEVLDPPTLPMFFHFLAMDQEPIMFESCL